MAKNNKLAELSDIFSEALKKLGVDSETARIHGMACSAEVKAYLGGSYIYIPKGTAGFPERNRRIYDEFNGANMEDICKKYRISESRVYAIVSAVREKNRTVNMQ